ncbi:putative holin-like toxin [Psychrobacillus lasiicapitis]
MISFSTLIVSIIALSYTFSQKKKPPKTLSVTGWFTMLNC